MMNKISAIIAVLALSLSFPLAAQKTAVFNEAQLAYKRGEDFFQKGVYGYALTEYNAAIHKLEPVNEPSWELLRMRAELGYAKSAVRLDLPDGENMILDFIRKYQPDPLASQALIEVANYFYNAQKYDKAIAQPVGGHDLTFFSSAHVAALRIASRKSSRTGNGVEWLGT